MKKERIINLIYIVVFLLMSLIPLIMFNAKQPAIGNESKVIAPKLSDGTKFPDEFDAYFSRYFGLRNSLVSLSNRYKKAMFKTSGQSEVIVGSDGWLFYNSALGDYNGSSRLSNVELDRVAVVIKMMQDYVTDNGKAFVFTIAPNKMSIYGDYMPYYHLKCQERGNYEMLFARLDGINAVALKNQFEAYKLNGGQIYHKLDSHWNNMGAALAYELIMKKMSDEYAGYGDYTEYTKLLYSIRNNFSGDLMAMLDPDSKLKDNQIYFDINDNFEYENTFRGVDDMWIKTTNSKPLVDKKVTLFRDSFGNALYYFFAHDYRELNARRQSSYDLVSAVDEADLVAIELVERNIKNLLVYSPIMLSPNIYNENRGKDIIKELFRETKILRTVKVNFYVTKTAAGFYDISGSCDELLSYSEFYIKSSAAMYQLIPAAGGEFKLYTEDEALLEAISEGKASLVIKKNGHYVELSIDATLQD